MKISIIVCSRTAILPQALVDNIEQTIFSSSSEHTYEIICIDNSNNQYNIFQAYNIGVARATGDIFCFQHDDICYHSIGWGDRVIDTLTPPIGCCAVAGATLVRKSPSWYSLPGYRVINIEQGGHTYQDTRTKVPLATFDGVWFCIQRECFHTIRFDDTSYQGFHFYDQDTALQLHAAGYRIVSQPDVFIEHQGSQTTDKQWLVSSYRFYDKWKHQLPLQTTATTVSTQELRRVEMEGIYTSLRLILRYRQFALLWKWFTMTGEVLEMNPLAAAATTLRHHWKQTK